MCPPATCWGGTAFAKTSCGRTAKARDPHDRPAPETSTPRSSSSAPSSANSTARFPAWSLEGPGRRCGGSPPRTPHSSGGSGSSGIGPVNEGGSQSHDDHHGEQQRVDEAALLRGPPVATARRKRQQPQRSCSVAMAADATRRDVVDLSGRRGGRRGGLEGVAVDEGEGGQVAVRGVGRPADRLTG